MPRRVLYLAWAPFFSGAERALVRALQGLDHRRYAPHVIVGTDGALARELREMGVDHSVLPLVPLSARRAAAAARSIGAVLWTARRIGAALVHANDVPSFQPGGYAARLIGLPAITHIRFPDTRAGYHWFLRTRLSMAIFVSEEQRTTGLREAPELFDGRAEVLRDCVDVQPTWTAADRDAMRVALGLPHAAPVIGLVGQISEVKGIWEFVAAADLLVRGGSPAHFAVIGDDLKTAGAVRAEMEARVRDAGLSARFHFVGFRPDAASIVQALDIAAVPSHVEPFGLAALEASAAGVPVVASRVGGLPEIVVENETGALVEPRDTGALANALHRLVQDEQRRAAFGAAGRARAQRMFGIAQYGSRLQAIYDRLCDRQVAADVGAEVKTACTD